MRIAYTQADGGVAIVIAAPKEVLLPLIGKPTGPVGIIELSDADYCAHIYARSIPADATNVHELPDDWQAPDREFRGAWVTDGKTITIDMPCAREIHRNKMRAARAPMLAALDVQYQRADETGDTVAKAAVISAKAALRDVTKNPSIDAAKNPNELKATWPKELKGQ